MEVNALLTPIKRVGARIIAITGNENSTLGTEADITLDAGVSTEACPLGAGANGQHRRRDGAGRRGDGPAGGARLYRRGLRAFPSWRLARAAAHHVRDVMRTGSAIPTVAPDATVAQALFEITGKGMGMTAVVAPDGAVAASSPMAICAAAAESFRFPAPRRSPNS